MSSDSKPQTDLKADVKRWLKARGLDYRVARTAVLRQ